MPLVALKDEVQFVPLLGLDFVNAPSYFLGLQVFVSGSVYPKFSGPSACPSMK